jgi:glycosyltransferase involved in cell wall biosynthesis
MSNTRPLKLGVFFDQVIDAGGGYQQALNAALLVKQLPKELVEPIFFTNQEVNIATLNDLGINTNLISISKFSRILLKTRGFVTHPILLNLWKKFAKHNVFERYFIRQSIDLIYFLAPTTAANDLEELNYITTLWDLCHRDDLEFPEVRSDRVFEVREKYFHRVLPKAQAVMVESHLGKLNVVRRYGIDKQRVHVMPLTAALGTQISESAYQAAYIDIPHKYRLTDPYIFYPAQFWAHKNHIYILQGLKFLEEQFGFKVGAIFSGGDKGNLEYVKQMVLQLGLSERVRFAGFVSNEEIPYLYKQSLALVMPTYFGPTNLPPLEAFNLGVPVLYSNKQGLREQVKNAALLMDLHDPMSMARHLSKLIAEPELRKRLVGNGKNLLEQYSDESRLKVLSTVLHDFQQRRICWN